MLTFRDKNGKMGLVEPETAALKALEVPVETRAAAVEHVVAPVEPAVAPVDKDSRPSEAPEAPEAPEALSFSRALPFLLAALPRYHILMTPAWEVFKKEIEINMNFIVDNLFLFFFFKYIHFMDMGNLER